MAQRSSVAVPSGLLALLVVGGLLAGVALPVTGPAGATAPAPLPKVVPAGSSGNGTIQCDGMYWSPNVTAWYQPSYCYGHDEPTVSYLSGAPGSGRNASFQITLPSSNGIYSQGDFYATIWFGGTVYDPLSLDQQAFLEFQFYPAPPTYTGANSGSQDCLGNGGFNEAWTSGTNDWFACAIVWEVYQSTEQDAANAAPLDLYGSTDAILVMHSGDHLFVNYTGVAQTEPWRLNVLDTTAGENGSIALENSTRHEGLGPYYATAGVGNILQWGASGPGAIAFAYEIGHALNPAIPENNPDGGCTPGDLVCDSYWPGRWGQMGQMELGLPVLGSGASAGFPLKMYYSSSQEGEAEVNASTSPVGSTCSAPSFSTSENCLYPWYQYRAGNYSFTFGATDVSNSTYDYGNEYEFPGFAQPDGTAVPHVVKAPWAWLNVTVAPADAQVQVNPLASVNLLPSSSTGVYSGQYLEGDYWLNASAPGCQSLSRAVYLKAMVNQTVGLVLTCPGSPTVPVSFLESGLPSGTSWAMDLSGLAGSASGKNITFNVSAGAYTAQPEDPVPGSSGVRYVPSPSEMLVQVGSSALQRAVSYATQVELTTAATPSSGGTVNPAGSSWFASGSRVSVTASPSSGYAFSSWTCAPTSACSSTTANPVTVTLNTPATVTASFVSLVPVSFLESGLPAGTSWQVTFNGVVGSASGSNITFNVTAGTYSYTVESPISGASGTRYVATPSSGSVTVGSAAQSVAISYQTQYQLTTGVSPAGSGSVSVPSGEWFASGTVVHITATPASGYVFKDWTCQPASACSTPTSNPVTVTMNAPTTATADFSGLVPVSFLESGLPSGTSWQVTFNGVVGSASGRNITFNVSAGTYSYSLESPIPGPTGIQFVTSPTSGTVTVGSSHLSEPVPYQTQYRLLTAASPSGGGTVSPSGTTWETPGTVVSVTATANVGYEFTGWSCTPQADCSGLPANPVTVTMSGPTTVLAEFGALVPVTFLESGLPSGTSWQVTFNGVVGSASGSNITFNVTAGTYPYTLESPVAGPTGTQFVTSPTSGTVTVAASHLSEPVSYQTQYQLTVTASPASEGTVTPSGTVWEDAGQPVTLTATPVTGYAFTGWACNPSSLCPAPASDPMTISLTAPGSATAGFSSATEPVSFVEQGLPSGTSWSVTFGGMVANAQGKNITFNVTAGSYSYLVPGPLSGGPGVRYEPSGASGTVPVGSHPVLVPVPFVTEYQLLVSGVPASDGRATPSSGWYASGTSVTLQAFPAGGYRFTGWASPNATGYRGLNNPETLVLGAPLEEQARFAPNLTYSITFGETGIPAGTSWSVTLSGNTLSSSTYTLTFIVANGSFSYVLEPEVHPTAAGERYQAESPGGNVTVSGQNVTLPALYEAEVYLTLATTGPGNGTVSPGSGWYGADTSLELRANPANGSVFDGWSGTGAASYSGPANPENLTLTQPVNETATFAPAPPLVGYVTGTVSPPNAQVTLGGQPVTVLPNGTFRVSLRPGQYFLNATLAGYAPYQTEVSVLAGKSVAVSISLTPSPSPPSPSISGPPGLEAAYLVLPPLVIVALVVVLWQRRRKKTPTGPAEPDGGTSR